MRQLRNFVIEYGDQLQGKTTRSAVDIIKEKTMHCHSNYLEWLAQNGRGGDITEPTVFVSHAWDALFLDFVAALESSYASETFQRLWIDIFAVPQNEQDRPWDDDDPDAFYDVVDNILLSIGTVAVVLAPFDQPVRITRAWCLYEHFLALEEGLRVSVLLPPRERRRLFAFLGAGDDPQPLYRRVVLAAAAARRPEDRRRLLARVRRREFGAVRRLEVRAPLSRPAPPR